MAYIGRKQKKAIRKAVNRTGRVVKNTIADRYVTKKKTLNLVQIAADVMKLKNLINVEKKRYDISTNSALLGQLNINAVGLNQLDITPLVAVGTGYNNRTGSSIKITSFHMKMQFWSQSANNHATKVIIDFFKVKGAPLNSSTFVAEYYSPNISTGLVDYNSFKDPDYFGTATKILTKEFTVPAPQYAGQLVQQDVHWGMKNFNHHVRFDLNTITIDDGQLIMVMRADSGNYGTVSSVSNVPVQTALSGLIFNYDMKYYYVDN